MLCNSLTNWREKLQHFLSVLCCFVAHFLELCVTKLVSWKQAPPLPTFTSNCKALSSLIHNVAHALFYIQCMPMTHWPSIRSRWLEIGKVLFCVFFFMDQGQWDQSKYKKKKEWGQLSSHLEWRVLQVNKGCIIWPKKSFSCRTNEGNPEQARWAHPAHSAIREPFIIWKSLHQPTHEFSQEYTCTVIL